VTAPSRIGWYVAAGVCALAGVAVAIAIPWWMIATREAPTRFLAPGVGAVEIRAPGRYVVWHEHRTVYEGRSFDLPPRLPHGVRLAVSAPDGVELRTEPTSMTERWGSVERAAIVAFDAPAPGRYVVAVRGDAQPFVLAVSDEFLWPMLKAIAAAIAAAVIGIGAGLALLLTALIRGAAAGAAPAAAGGALDAGAEKRLRDLAAIVYGLQALALVFGVTAIAGVIVNYLKRAEVAGSWLEAHFAWQIRTFWWTLAWGVVGVASAILIVGFFVLIGAAIWYVYRIAKGWTALNDGVPVGAG